MYLNKPSTEERVEGVRWVLLYFYLNVLVKMWKSRAAAAPAEAAALIRVN